MKIVVLVEGKTEIALRTKLNEFINDRLKLENKSRIGIDTKSFKGTPDCDQIKDRVEMNLNNPDVIAVVGLLDVYPNFKSAGETKNFLRDCVGDEPRFYPHAAQFDFEAWLMPFWDDICRKLKINKKSPGANPEQINLNKPPSKYLEELYRLAKSRYKYDKIRDAYSILKDKDLTYSAKQCTELKSFLNTLLNCVGLNPI